MEYHEREEILKLRAVALKKVKKLNPEMIVMCGAFVQG